MALRKYECCKQCSNYPNEGCKSPNICRACCDGSEFTAKKNPFRQKQESIITVQCPHCFFDNDVDFTDLKNGAMSKDVECEYCRIRFRVITVVTVSYEVRKLQEVDE